MLHRPHRSKYSFWDLKCEMDVHTFTEDPVTHQCKLDLLIPRAVLQLERPRPLAVANFVDNSAVARAAAFLVFGAVAPYFQDH